MQPLSRAHALADAVHEVAGPDDVGFDHPPRRRPVLVEKTMPQPLAGIGAEDIDRAAGDQVEQILHPLLGGKVGLHRVDIDAQALEGLDDLALVGGDSEIVAVLRA
jgi:hypothetical protein